MPGGYSYELLQERLTCNQSRSTQTSTPDFHLHNYFEMYFLLDGNVTFLIEDQRWQLSKGDLVLLNNREVHKSVNPGGELYSRYVIHFDPALLAGFGGEGRENILLAHFDRDAGYSAVLHIEDTAFPAAEEKFRIMEEALAQGTAESFIRAQAYLVLLLCSLHPMPDAVPQEPRIHNFSAQVIEYLQVHATEPFSLDHLEEVFRVNKHHLCRRFKQETGGTIYHYLLLKRIAIAQALLAQGESVSAACDAAGFSDYANFIRSFKKQTGVSPGQYRKQFSV